MVRSAQDIPSTVRSYSGFSCALVGILGSTYHADMKWLRLPSPRLSTPYLCALLMFTAGLHACGSDGDGDSTLEVEDEDLPKEASVKIGSKGGTVKARGVTLEIPEGALEKEVLISAKNLGKSKPSSVKAKQVSDRYEFGPEGTKFNKSVTVSFKTEESNAKAKVYFTKENSSEFEKLATTDKGNEASAKVRHFSQGFVGIPEDEDSEQIADAAVGESPEASVNPGPDAGGTGSDPDASVEPDAQVPPKELKHIVFNVQNEFGQALSHHWAVLQDGQGGAFTQITATNGAYAFEVENEHFAVLFLCRNPTSGASIAHGFYRYTTGSQTYTVQAPNALCAQPAPPTTYEMTTRVTYAAPYDYRYGHHARTVPTLPSSLATVNVGYTIGAETTDFLFAAGASQYTPAFMLVVRNITAPPAGATPDYDLRKQGVAFDAPVRAQVSNVTESTEVSVRFTTRGTRDGLVLDAGTTGGKPPARFVDYAVPPTSIRLASDRFVLFAEDGDAGSVRKVVRTSAAPITAASMPDALEAKFDTAASGYTRPVYLVSERKEASHYVLSALYTETRTLTHEYTLEVDPRWLTQAGGQSSFTFPELSQVQGFLPAWVAGGTRTAQATARWATATSNVQDEYEVSARGSF